MSTSTINLPDGTTLDAAQVAHLVAQIKANEASQKAAQKAKREKSRTLVADFVTTVVHELDEQSFSSGARGYSLGGSKIDAYGRSWRVSVLIRDEATIPAKDEEA